MAVAGEVRRDFRQAANILAAVLRRETEIAIEAGAQSVTVEQQGNASTIKQSSFQSTSESRFSGCGQARQPYHCAIMAVAARAFLRAYRRFHWHDVDWGGALSGIDRQHEA